MKRRAFLGLGASSIGVGALYGTGAFSSVSAGRGVSISAADDPAALVGLDIVDEVESNSLNELLTVTNNFDNTFDFTIELTNDATKEDFNLVINDEEEGNKATVAVNPGPEESQQIDIEIDGGGHNEAEDISFDADVSGQISGSVSLSRDDITVTTPNDGGGGDDGPSDQPDGDILFETLTATVTNTGGPDNTPTEVEFTYELSEQADIEFGIVCGSRSNSEIVEGGPSLDTFTLDSGGGGRPSGSSSTVSGDIVGGEECSTEVEEGDEDIPICD